MQRCTDETRCAVPSSNSMGRVKGQQRRGWGTRGRVKRSLLSVCLGSFEPRWKVWGRHWPHGMGQKLAHCFLKCPQFKTYVAFQSQRCGMVRCIHQSPTHFAEPEKWIAATWQERIKKQRGRFVPGWGRGVPSWGDQVLGSATSAALAGPMEALSWLGHLYREEMFQQL